MSNAIQKHNNISTPSTLLEMAVQQNADLDKLEKLMDLQERWNREQAKNAFNEALAGFQSELEPIFKTRKAHNSTYADIDDIAKAIRPVLEKHGLSYQFKQSQNDSQITVTCTVRHKLGHSEENTLTATNDTSGGKNAIQAIASAVTYLRRYTLTGALGITTGTDDNDGGQPSITVDQLLEYNTLVRDLFPTIASVKSALSTHDFSSAKEAWNELTEQEMKALWRAPTKGGIWTTLEREQMKSNEWSKA